MLEIRNVKVYDLEESVCACRNAMRTELPEYDEVDFENSLMRAKRLVTTSANSEHVKCHDNFLVGIRVSFDLKYEQYIAPEIQRYHFFDIVTSMSKMHKLMSREVDSSCNKYTSKESVKRLQYDIDRYNKIAKAIREREFVGAIFVLRNGEVIEDVIPDDALYHARMIAMSDVPGGYELWERVSTNYKQLQTMYWQRRNHRLVEDWREFCKFVESLPYAQELIIGNHIKTYTE